MANQKIQYIAMRSEEPGYGLLPQRVVDQWMAIQEAIRLEWLKSREDQTFQPISLLGCLEKLSSALMQARRLRDHQDQLLLSGLKLIEKRGSCIAMRGSEACADLEGLLLQGRAALDRLARLLGSRYKNSARSFRTIARIVESFVHRDADAEALYKILAGSSGWFDGAFGQLTEEASLRDVVAHNHALMEGVVTCFAIHRVDPDSLLMLDCEIDLPKTSRRFPVLQTARESAQWLSYVVLNCAAVVSGVPTLELSSYESKWRRHPVALSKFVIAETAGSEPGSCILSTVQKTTPDGFVWTSVRVDSSIFETRISPKDTKS